jgi:rod shape-determining protein MreC
LSSIHESGRRPLFPRGPGVGLRFFVLAVIAGGLLFADLRGAPQLVQVRAWLSWALAPVVALSTSPHYFHDLDEQFQSHEALLSQNQALKKELFDLRARQLRYQALEAENNRLRSLLASSAALKQRVLVGEVLETSQDPYQQQMLINRGSDSSVYRGQSVVDAWGVMGQVTRVAPTSSTVLLITDPDSGLPVEINRTGLQTIAVGRGIGRALVLPYLPGNADVRVGDVLVTSGLGGRFPPGYPVGTIQSLRHPPGESFMEAIARPAAHLDRGRQVLLVWNPNHGKLKPLSDSDATANPSAPAAKPTPNLPTGKPSKRP